MPGAMLSLSANGSTPGTGILWASHPTNEDANQGIVPGTLRAIDASNLSNELWNSDQAPHGRDLLGNIAKFSPPTIADGRVYAGTFSGKIVVYGHI
jgi:outer membrane protein assembly factor BamB